MTEMPHRPEEHLCGTLESRKLCLIKGELEGESSMWMI